MFLTKGATFLQAYALQNVAPFMDLLVEDFLPLYILYTLEYTEIYQKLHFRTISKL